jgi:Effector-associated domain 11
MDEQTKEQIRDYIANAKLDKALAAFKTWADANGDTELKNAVAMKTGENARLRNDKNMGFITSSEEGQRRARLGFDILQLIDDAQPVGQNSNNPTILPPQPPPNSGSTSAANQPAGAPKPLKTLLFMGANPPNTRILQLEIEHSRIAAKLNNTFKIEVEKFTSASDIPELIVSKEPNIIHFSGHGKDPNSDESGQTTDSSDSNRLIRLPDSDNHQGGIVVFDDDMRRMKVLEDDVLDYLFQSAVNELGIKIEVVVFNSCHSESQAKVICKYVDFVVGTARSISDDVAIAFASGFYFAIGQGKTVEKAFTTGKMQAVIKDIKAKDLIILYKNGERQKL